MQTSHVNLRERYYIQSCGGNAFGVVDRLNSWEIFGPQPHDKCVEVCDRSNARWQDAQSQDPLALAIQCLPKYIVAWVDSYGYVAPTDHVVISYTGHIQAAGIGGFTMPVSEFITEASKDYASVRDYFYPTLSAFGIMPEGDELMSEINSMRDCGC